MNRCYKFARGIDLADKRVDRDDAERQKSTAEEVLARFRDRPGVVLADEVGMGKTFVALAVATSMVLHNPKAGPVVVMVPPSLKDKWPRDFRIFNQECLTSALRDKIRFTPKAVESGVEFLRLLDDPPDRMCGLIFLTHGALSGGLTDRWVKLALIRRAFRRSSLGTVRRRFPRFAARLLQMATRRVMNAELFDNLLRSPFDRWGKILRQSGIAIDREPVPSYLITAMRRLNLDELAAGLDAMPRHEGASIHDRIESARERINVAFRNLWSNWLANACREKSLPLLILDEAHHLKNPHTRLPSLFRASEAEEEADLLGGPLNGMFERMLFLTATPFQLGHHELLRVVERFQDVSWRRTSAPRSGRESVSEALGLLRVALDNAQMAALTLDRVWGRLRQEDIVDGKGKQLDLEEWWAGLPDSKGEGNCTEVLRRYSQASEAFLEAQVLLRPWVIRHLKLRTFSGSGTPRREELPGAAIVPGTPMKGNSEVRGIEIEGAALLPFILAARAQAIVAVHQGTTALFAEGLASSYEAYRETRLGKALHDEDELGESAEPSTSLDSPDSPSNTQALAKSAGLDWYLDNLDQVMPRGDALRRGTHPKVAATVDKAVELWKRGEKVLVFCHYRATGRALNLHVSRRLDAEIVRMAKIRFKLQSLQEARRRLTQLGKRFQSRDDRLRRDVDRELFKLTEALHDFSAEEKERIVDVLRRFIRTPSFLARFFPPSLLRRGGAVKMLFDQPDSSGLTLRKRLSGFFQFLSERTEEERSEYLEALETVNTGSHRAEGGRLLANVRLANGETKPDTRRRLLLAFNAPFFPEILIASSVLGEGVDLHLDCRYVIHHDLCWNPSTLEQRTGRIDRLGCKGERTRLPITVYLPFVAATQDEKMFRVVRDRGRWFQVVMGEKYEVDEAATDRRSERVPLPESAARALAFQLSIVGEQS